MAGGATNVDAIPPARARVFQGYVSWLMVCSQQIIKRMSAVTFQVGAPCDFPISSTFQTHRKQLSGRDVYKEQDMRHLSFLSLGKVLSFSIAVSFFVALAFVSNAQSADEPDLIFRRSTVFKWLTPNDKLATYGLDDPEVDGVACHFTVPERGGFKGWIGVAEEVSDISLSCSQVGPIIFKAKFEQGEDVFRKRRSLFFKKMQIVRGCDVKRNALVYMVYSDRIIEGSPKNSTSSVPIIPWGSDIIVKCADWIEK
jgi:CreA protein